jgi:hypothetical protein
LPRSRLIEDIIDPCVTRALDAFLAELDGVTVAELCLKAERQSVLGDRPDPVDFTI